MTIMMTTTARVDGKNQIAALTCGNVLGHEIIGLPVRVSSSHDSTKVGVTGAIVDETMNTILIETRNGDGETRIMVLPKSESHFTLELPSGELIEIDGCRMIEHPWERTKKLAKNLKRWR